MAPTRNKRRGNTSSSSSSSSASIKKPHRHQPRAIKVKATKATRRQDEAYSPSDPIDTRVYKYRSRIHAIIREFKGLDSNYVSEGVRTRPEVRYSGTGSFYDVEKLIASEQALRNKLSSPFFQGFSVRMLGKETKVGRYVGDMYGNGYRSFELMTKSAWEQLCKDNIPTEKQQSAPVRHFNFFLGNRLSGEYVFLDEQRWQELVTEEMFADKDNFYIAVDFPQTSFPLF